MVLLPCFGDFLTSAQMFCWSELDISSSRRRPEVIDFWMSAEQFEVLEPHFAVDVVQGAEGVAMGRVTRGRAVHDPLA
jgi:hypothetical protein